MRPILSKGRGWRLAAVMLVAAVTPCAGVATAGDLASIESEPEPWTPVPFRVRNLTFPTVLVMGSKPAPVVSLPRGSWAVELDWSVSNNFQASSGVERYLAQRGGQSRPLSSDDVEAIRGRTTGDQFFVDGELRLLDLGLHYGLTDSLDISVRLSHLDYGGDTLDPVIRGFHDLAGIGQGARQYVPNGEFQAVFVSGDRVTEHLDRPTSGGFTDPVLSLRWAVPGDVGEWRFGLEAGVKLPVADEKLLLSSGSFDAGVQLTAERQWRRDAVVLNLSLVAPGKFESSEGFTPPDLPALDVAWVHRLGPHTSAVVQALFSENIFREVTDSDLAEVEFQLTTGLTWRVGDGRLGVGMTENLFNYDNTPDFAVHLSYGVMID